MLNALYLFLHKRFERRRIWVNYGANADDKSEEDSDASMSEGRQYHSQPFFGIVEKNKKQ